MFSHNKTPSCVAAAIIAISATKKARVVRGVLLMDIQLLAGAIIDHLKHNSARLRMRQTTTALTVLVHETLWDAYYAQTMHYQPFPNEPELKKVRSARKGTVGEDDLMHALRWAAKFGRDLKHYDFSFPINRLNAKKLLALIEKN